MFLPLDNYTFTSSVSSAGVTFTKPAASDTALIQNHGSSVLLVGYQGMPTDANGFRIPANTAAELRLLSMSLFLKREAGATTETVTVSFGADQ